MHTTHKPFNIFLEVKLIEVYYLRHLFLTIFIKNKAQAEQTLLVSLNTNLDKA